MKTFIEFISESTAMSAPLDDSGLRDAIGKTKFNSMKNHPFCKEYVASASLSGKSVAFRHWKNHLGDHNVEALVYDRNNKDSEGKIVPSHSVHFNFYKNRVSNAHLFRDIKRITSGDNVSFVGRHVKSHKEV